MAKKYKLLRAGMTRSACNESRDKTVRLLKEKPLHELPYALGVPHAEAIGDPEFGTQESATHEA